MRLQLFTCESATIQRLVARRCYDRVKSAVASGWLKKPKKCTRCGKKGPLEAHHPDYLEPLNVSWICRSCQRTLHADLEKDLRKVVDGILPFSPRRHGKDGRFISREERVYVQRRLMDFRGALRGR